MQHRQHTLKVQEVFTVAPLICAHCFLLLQTSCVVCRVYDLLMAAGWLPAITNAHANHSSIPTTAGMEGRNLGWAAFLKTSAVAQIGKSGCCYD